MIIEERETRGCNHDDEAQINDRECRSCEIDSSWGSQRDLVGQRPSARDLCAASMVELTCSSLQDNFVDDREEVRLSQRLGEVVV